MTDKDAKLDQELSDRRRQEFLAMPEHSFAILQLKRAGYGISMEEWHKRAFEPLSRMRQHGIEPDEKTYLFVYTGAYHEGIGSKNAVLEHLYNQFNLHHPEDYTGHSLSVGDVVVLKQDGTLSCHYCDSFGFKELPDFLPEQHKAKDSLDEQIDAAKETLKTVRSAQPIQSSKEQNTSKDNYQY